MCVVLFYNQPLSLFTDGVFIVVVCFCLLAGIDTSDSILILTTSTFLLKRIHIGDLSNYVDACAKH